MFPNVRLMIAATLASVVALICGFGMFAVFRVSHDPFVRLPAATAPLQLVADNAARPSTGFASGEAFDRRFEVKALPYAAEDTNAAAAAAEPRTGAEIATAAQPSEAAREETPATVGEPTEQPSASTAPPTSEAPAVTSDNTAASDQANIASESPPVAATQTTTADAGMAAPAPDLTTTASDQDIKSPVVSMPSVEPAPGAAADIAANEPLEEPPLPRERPNLTTEPTRAANPADERAHKTAAKKPKRIRVAVRIRRVPRVAVTPYAQTQYSPTTEQNFGATQTNFQTAPPSQTQLVLRRAIWVRHSRIASRKPTQPNAATGGPFVRATSR